MRRRDVSGRWAWLAALLAGLVILLAILAREVPEAARPGPAASPSAGPGLPAAGLATKHLVQSHLAIEPGSLAVPMEARTSAGRPPTWPPVFLGVVKDSQGYPVEGALVLFLCDERARADVFSKWEDLARLRDRRTADFPWVTTDAAGKFVLDGHLRREGPVVPSGLVDLIVRAEGFAPCMVDASGLAGPVQDVGALHLVPAAVVRGRVIGRDGGAPVAGACLRLSGPSAGSGLPSEKPSGIQEITHGTWTDAEGRFEYRDLRAGSYDLEVDERQHVVEFFRDLRLEPGAIRDLGVIQLTPGGVVAGVVLDPSGAPIADAAVAAFTLDLQEVAHSDSIECLIREERTGRGWGRSDSDGRFELVGLSGHLRSLVAHARGYAWACALDVGDGRRDVVIRLGRPAELAVSVTDADSGLPIEASIDARAIGSHGAVPPPLEVRGSGRGRMLVVDPGERATQLVVSAPGFVSYDRAIPGVPRGGGAEQSIALSPARSLRGQVVDGAGQPVPGANVTLLVHMDSELYQSQMASYGYLAFGEEWEYLDEREAGSPDGRFVFEGLPGGDYRLHVTAQGYGPARTEAVQVGAPSAPEVLVRLGPSGGIQGVVRDAAGQGLGDISVRVRKPDDDWDATTTAPDGSFSFSDLEPGAHTVWIETGRGGGERQATAVRVTAGELTQVLLVLPDPATLVVIVELDGRPMAGTQVRVEPSSGQRWTTDARGEAAIPVEPGLVEVFVATPGGGSATTTADVRPGERSALLVRMPAGGLDVLARDAATNELVAGVPLIAARLDDDGDPDLLGWTDQSTAIVRTEAAGRALIEGLQAGWWTVLVESDEWEAVELVRALVPDDGVASVVVPVQRLLSVSGRARHAGGELAARILVVLIPMDGAHDGWADSCWTDEDGSFSFERIRTRGRHRIVVPRSESEKDFASLGSIVHAEVDLAGAPIGGVELTLPAVR